jgi:hypothetical protein
MLYRDCVLLLGTPPDPARSEKTRLRASSRVALLVFLNRMTQKLELDCLDQLEATPAILRGLMCDLSVEDAEWKPALDRFSVAEVLAHLSHSEGHCYRTRVDRFMSEELPEFEPDDAQMYLELYRNANAEDSFEHFEGQRETNVEYLRTLPRSAGERRARHPEVGEITLQQMLHEWTMHDLGHIRQIAELNESAKSPEGCGKTGR